MARISIEERRRRDRERKRERRKKFGRGPLSAEQKRANQIDREIETSMRHTDPAIMRARQERALAMQRAQQKRWAKENPDKIAASNKKWRRDNLDYHRQADNDRYAQDPEKFKAKARAYYLKNRATINAKRRKVSPRC